MSSITFSIQILKLNVLPSYKINDTTILNNVVVSVVFNYKGIRQSDGKICTFTNEKPLDLPNSNSNYTDYHQLTEQEVISWLESDEELIKSLQKLINDWFDQNQPTTLPLPWISP